MANHSISIAEPPADMPAKPASLSKRTDRDRSAIIGEAVAGFVDHTLAITAQIEEGLAASRAGRLVGHEALTRKARTLIEGGRI